MATLLNVAIFSAAVVALSFWLSRLGSGARRRDRREAPKGETTCEGRPARFSAGEQGAVVQPSNFTAPVETPLRGRRSRPAHVARKLKGRVHVIDGDTIVIKNTKIRLAGIDAPELDQPYGNKAKWAMVEICRNEVVVAHPNGDTSHDRIVATCYLSDGTDIGAELIRRGLALDWPLFSGGKYRHLECPAARRRILNGRRWHKSQNCDVSGAGGQP